MLDGRQLAFIGAGNMAQAMIRGLLAQGLVTPDQIVASGPRPERGQELQERYGVHTTTSNPEAAEQAHIVVLSVKPQVLPKVLPELRGHLQPGTLIISIFLFMEALIDAAVHLGFSRHVAEELVLQTIEGALAMARTTGEHPAVLRNRVTSPGGTSAEALYQLEKGGFRTVLSKAVWAAFKKSQYLGDLSERQIEREE